MQIKLAAADVGGRHGTELMSGSKRGERKNEGVGRKRNENRKGGRRRRSEERKTERTETNKPVENSRPGTPGKRLNDEREREREREEGRREGEEREVWITFRKGVCGWE